MSKNKKIEKIIDKALKDTIMLYTDYALIVNSMFVAKKYYKENQVALSTTKGIPDPLRLPTEIDVVYSSKDLIDLYDNKLINFFCLKFLVDLVANFDIWIENIYTELLKNDDPSIGDSEVEKKLKASWTTDNKTGRPIIISYILNHSDTKQPTGKISTMDHVLSRYEEIREVRHAIMHSDGKLTQKHVLKLQMLSKIKPVIASPSPYPNMSPKVISEIVLEQGISLGSKVLMDIDKMLAVRRWSYDTLAYFKNSLL